MSYNIFEKTALLKSLTYKVADLVERVNLLEVDKSTLSTQENYLINVFLATYRIIDTYEQLKHIEIYFDRFLMKRLLIKHNINSSQYIQYHLENHLIRISTVLDQFLILVNDVYFLGFSHKQCKYKPILKELKLYNKLMADALVLLNNEIDNSIKQRHLIVHRGHFDDSGVLWLKIYEHLHKTDKSQNWDFNLKLQDDCAIYEKIETIQNSNKIVYEHIIYLFNLLGLEFDLQYMTL